MAAHAPHLLAHPLATITIDKDSTGKLRVTPPSALADKENGVTWSCTDPFVVVFYVDTDDPFNSRVFTDNNPHSGVAKVKHNSARRYKYLVAAFGQSIDPDVIIDS
jgi:hypothetical protein